jgi:hypothetical protein
MRVEKGGQAPRSRAFRRRSAVSAEPVAFFNGASNVICAQRHEMMTIYEEIFGNRSKVVSFEVWPSTGRRIDHLQSFPGRFSFFAGHLRLITGELLGLPESPADARSPDCQLFGRTCNIVMTPPHPTPLPSIVTSWRMQPVESGKRSGLAKPPAASLE